MVTMIPEYAIISLTLEKIGVFIVRIVFCDDDPAIIEQLLSYVTEFFAQSGGKQAEFACYPSGDALLNAEARADIAFLDVEMPGVSGICVGARLKERNPNIKIFIVTSYPDYLDEAMRFQVFRYLSKPIDKNRLFRNLKDAVYQYNMESHEFPIVTNEGVYVRRAEEIICVEAAQRKIFVHTTDGILQSTQNMEHWRQALTLPCFYMTHRSYIVNLHFVNSIRKDTILLKYRDIETTAYLTRRRYTTFKDTYLWYMESVK